MHTSPGDLDWLTAMRLELHRYQTEKGDSSLTLHQLYDFSESRLSAQFPNNDHVRAKIRQLLQHLRDRGEVEFLDDAGTYNIKELQIDDSVSSHLTVGLSAQTHGFYLIPVSDDWRDKFRNSVEEPHDLQQYAEVPPQLEGIDRLKIWGATETDADKKQSAIDAMESGDCILFYHNGEFFSGGVVGRTFENPDVGELLWNNPESRHLFTVDEFTYDVPRIESVWDMLGYEGRQVVQGFTRVADERVEKIQQEHGSLESVLFGDEDSEPPEEEIEREKSELEQAVESEPELTEDETQYVETRRRARDYAFTQLVREAYNNTCAVCGSQRESPDGNPEVEAAHIYPLSEGGRNDVRNGVALCKFHHWAFDSGWLSFTDDHRIIVKEAPDKNGYYELKQLEGQSLQLPNNENAHPHPMFIKQHRELFGFEQ